MIHYHDLLSGIGFIGISAGLLAQTVTGIPPELSGIPWASFASSGTMVVGMALALRYTAGRQAVNEQAVKEAHEKHIATLLEMLQHAKSDNAKDRELLMNSLNRLGDTLEAMIKNCPYKGDK